MHYQHWHLSYTGWKPIKNSKQNPIPNCIALSYSKWPNQYHLKSLTILSIFIFTIFLFFHKIILILIIIYTLSFIVFTLTFLLQNVHILKLNFPSLSIHTNTHTTKSNPDHRVIQRDKANYRQVSFCGRVTFLKNAAQIDQKLPFKIVYFMGVRGLTTSSYIVYDYATRGHRPVNIYCTYNIYAFL